MGAGHLLPCRALRLRLLLSGGAGTDSCPRVPTCPQRVAWAHDGGRLCCRKCVATSRVEHLKYQKVRRCTALVLGMGAGPHLGGQPPAKPCPRAVCCCRSGSCTRRRKRRHVSDGKGPAGACRTMPAACPPAPRLLSSARIGTGPAEGRRRAHLLWLWPPSARRCRRPPALVGRPPHPAPGELRQGVECRQQLQLSLAVRARWWRWRCAPPPLAFRGQMEGRCVRVHGSPAAPRACLLLSPAAA